MLGALLRCNTLLFNRLPPSQSQSQSSPNSNPPCNPSNSLPLLAQLLHTPIALNQTNKIEGSKSHKKITAKQEKACFNIYQALATALCSEKKNTNTPTVLSTLDTDTLFQQLFAGSINTFIPSVARGATRCMYLLTTNTNYASNRQSLFALRCNTYFKNNNKSMNALPELAGDELATIYFLRAIANVTFSQSNICEENVWFSLYSSLIKAFADPRPVVSLAAVSLVLAGPEQSR